MEVHSLKSAGGQISLRSFSRSLGCLGISTPTPIHLLAGFLSFSSVRFLYVAELYTEYHATRILIVVGRSIARIACGSADTVQMCAASQGM